MPCWTRASTWICSTGLQVEAHWPPAVRADLHALHARALVARGDRLEAQREIERAEEVAAGRLEIRLSRIALAMSRNRTSEAVTLAREATGEYPESARAWRVLYQVAAANDDLELARTAVDRAIALAARPTEHHLFRARLRVTQGDLEGARADLEAVGGELQGHPRVRFVEALIAWVEADYETACDQLQQAVSDAPQFVEARFYLGVCQVRSGELNQAEAHLRWVNQRQPEPVVARLLGRVLLALDQPERARDVVRPIVQRNPEDSEALALMGRIEMELGNTSEAIEYLQRQVRLRPDDPTVKLQLGTGLMQSGQLKAGRVAIREALELDLNRGAQARCW
ncbi:MAG: tetratricopeptide repeat protein [Halofilum sp. (in: g-proteobacteria)]|nr:tetratricopeptide repeat protein [Halofilum sp. (in: g-proteobacteria)]